VIVDVELVLDAKKRGDEGRDPRWRQTSTYRFAAVDVNAWVKVEVLLGRR